MMTPPATRTALSPASGKTFVKVIDPTKVGWTVPARGSSLRIEATP
jgi:hypothetical protein